MPRTRKSKEEAESNAQLAGVVPVGVCRNGKANKGKTPRWRSTEVWRFTKVPNRTVRRDRQCLCEPDFALLRRNVPNGVVLRWYARWIDDVACH